jgi:hypothetical protein
VQAEALETIDRAARRWDGESLEGDYHGDVSWQLIQNMSTGHGIDISDEASPLVQCLKIAARDNTPERILANCEHLLVGLGSTGPIALFIKRTYNLGTAGSKVVHCTKFDYHVEGRDQDSAYEVFRERHCKSCPDVSPRPSDWKYVGDERKRIEARSPGFITRLLGTANGYRYSEKD